MGKDIRYWGKLNQTPDGQILERHPLIAHCADVAACCEALLTHTLLRKRLATLAGLDDLSPVNIARLSFLAALHDIGKFNQGFQNKALAKPPFTAGHVREVVSLLRPDTFSDQALSDKLLEALSLEPMLAWAKDEEQLVGMLVASVCHHGKPISFDTAGATPDQRIWAPWPEGDSPFDGIRQLVGAAAGWFPLAFEQGAALSASPEVQHAFSGLVMLADWLGSSKNFFPFCSAEQAIRRIEEARQWAQEVFTQMGLAPARARALLGGQPPAFSLISQFSPRPLQSKTLALESDPTGSLSLLEAETGAGKTEAALIRYLRLFHAGEVDGLFFALPTRTAATQIYRRVCEAIERAFTDPQHRPPVVLAVPGYLSVDETAGQRLPGFEVLWNDSESERFRYRGWAAENAKRYLAGAIVVGTIDQALLSALQVSHAHLRSTALLRHLLVVDEVHASDAYMTRLLQAVLRTHLGAGGHVLLMSATLGAEARHCYLKAAGLSLSLPTVEQTCELPYPAITHLPHGGAIRTIPIEGALSRSFTVTMQAQLSAPAQVAATALEAARLGARVLIIKNTVKGCVELQSALEQEAEARGLLHLLFRCDGVVAPHHSRFARDDRQKLDSALEAIFAVPDRQGGCVIVATQTVQQSLDLDADLLITDLCPMDVLLQRAGRLHRHRTRDEHRPEAFRKAQLIVLTPEERDLGPMIGTDGQARGEHGLGSVYDDLRIIEATWRQLEKHPVIEVPQMCRSLVEHTTHPHVLDAICKDLGGSWMQHQIQMLGQTLTERRFADIVAVERSQAFGQEASFVDAKTGHKVSTRLGESDRQVDFQRPLPSPFGGSIKSLSIPAHLSKGLSDPLDAKPLADTGAFELDGRTFRYDRLGLRPFEPEPSEEFLDA